MLPRSARELNVPLVSTLFFLGKPWFLLRAIIGLGLAEERTTHWVNQLTPQPPSGGHPTRPHPPTPPRVYRAIDTPLPSHTHPIYAAFHLRLPPLIL